MGILVLFLFLRGILAIFPHSIWWLALGFLYIDLMMLRCAPFIPIFCRVLNMNGCWILSNVFSASIEMIYWNVILFSSIHMVNNVYSSASIEMIMWFVFFSLIYMCITCIVLRMLNQPCFPGMKPTWSWCMIFLMWFWMPMASILFRIFFIYVH